jgi:hypothetical protein
MLSAQVKCREGCWVSNCAIRITSWTCDDNMRMLRTLLSHEMWHLLPTWPQPHFRMSPSYLVPSSFSLTLICLTVWNSVIVQKLGYSRISSPFIESDGSLPHLKYILSHASLTDTHNTAFLFYIRSPRTPKWSLLLRFYNQTLQVPVTCLVHWLSTLYNP